MERDLGPLNSQAKLKVPGEGDDKPITIGYDPETIAIAGEYWKQLNKEFVPEKETGFSGIGIA